MKRALCTAALFALVSSNSALAAFYVDDEVPHQPAVTAQPSTSVSTFDIPFFAKRGWLTLASRGVLAVQLPKAQAAEAISLVVSTPRRGAAKLAKQRADALKQWLAENGVDPDKIAVVEDTEPRARDQMDVVTVSMTVRNRPAAATVSATRTAAARLAPVYHAPVVVAAPQPARPLINDQTKIALLQRIVAMGKNGIVKPEEAFALVAEVVNMDDLAPQAAAPSVAAAPPAASHSPAPISVATLIAADVPRQWNLDNTKTLRGNLDEWTRTAGWEAPTWQAVNQYQIMHSTTLHGTFYSALEQLAAAVPALDFSVSKSRRTLRVSEAAR